MRPIGDPAMSTGASKRLRKDVVDALRNGAVPRKGLHLYATGMDRFAGVIDEELADVAAGRSKFKAVRGAYGGGKTFFSRWLQDRALKEGFAVAEVQISEVETPLHKTETVYRRAMERLATRESESGSFRDIVDGWFYTLEEELRAAGELTDRSTDHQVHETVAGALDNKLRVLSDKNPQFASVLRAYHRCTIDNDEPTAEGLIAWLCGAPGISASVKKKAGVKGDIDSRMAFNFLTGLTMVLRFSGRKGLVLVLDEVETIQRMRSDTREKSLNGLRQMVDYTADGTLPNLYLMITGTPEFYESPWGVKRLEPLAQRLETHFGKNPEYDNIRATQVRLTPFNESRLLEVGHKVRDIYPAKDPQRIQTAIDDAILGGLVEKVLGSFRGNVGVAPRIYLKKLVDLVDRVNDHPGFDARGFLRDELKVSLSELSDEEKALLGGAGEGPKSKRSLDDIDIQVDE